MLLRTLDYEEQFRCLAGRCPHSCCVGWEVMLDEDHARRYLAGDDPLSRRAAEAMVYDETEDAFAFPLSGGRCPFLDGENLCELHRAWGAEATPLTCQTHPRFTEDYGEFAERALSAACPAANVLLLGSREPLGFREIETGETGETGEEGDDWLPYLVPFRRRLFALLQDRSRPLRARLAEFLILCLLADAVLTDAELDGTAPEALLTLEGGTLEGELPEEGIFPAGFRLLASLEVLEPNWRDVLRKAETVAPVPQDEALLERVAVYFAYRSILKCVNDGDLLGRGLYTVFLTLAAERIAAVCGLGEALRRLSREVEHDADNVEALLAAFRGGADFDVGRFLRELRNS